MKYIKTYELLNGGRIMKSAVNILKASLDGNNKLMQAIVEKNDNDFKYELALAIKMMTLENTNKYGNTALLVASKEGRLKMLKDLLKNGANIQHKNNAGEDFYDLAINRFKFINGVKDWIEKAYPEFVIAKKYNL